MTGRGCEKGEELGAEHLDRLPMADDPDTGVGSIRKAQAGWLTWASRDRRLDYLISADACFTANAVMVSAMRRRSQSASNSER